MIGIGLALLAAIINAFSVVLVRKWMHKSNALNISLSITLTGNVILWPLATLLTNLSNTRIEGIFLFALAGALAPGLVRLFYYKGMKMVGASANASIFATHPIYSSLFAALFLQDIPSLGNWLGIICIFVAVLLIERSLNKDSTSSRKVLKSMLIPLLGTLTYALSQVVRKYGLNIYNEPLLGVSIGYGFSLLVYVLLTSFSSNSGKLLNLSKDFRFFWKAGVGLSVGWLLVFYALSFEKVSVIAPLLQTESLFVSLFAYLFVNELDRLSTGLLLSAFLMFLGVILVGIG